MEKRFFVIFTGLAGLFGIGVFLYPSLLNKLSEGANAPLSRVTRPRALSMAASVGDSKKACAAGNKSACHDLAVDYMDKKHIAKAYELYEANCQNGYLNDCFNRGYYANKEKKYDEARKWQILGCAGNDGESCTGLGMVEENTGNFEKALKAYADGCRRKEIHGCEHVRYLHYNLFYLGDHGLALWNAIKDDKARIASLSDECGKGDLNSCNLQGWAQARSNPNQASPILKKACRAGHSQSCVTLLAVSKFSFHDSISFEELACQGDIVSACVAAADMHLNENDGTKADIFYRAACKLGRESSYALPAVDHHEPGANARLKKAYQKECDSGDPGGCGWLSFVEGRTGNREAASVAHRDACNFGDEYTCPPKN